MKIDSPEAKAFLFELYTMTGGDTEAQVSMYDVGQALGLERQEAGMMAETLYTLGYAELKTLSGGIGVTGAGLEVLQVKGASKTDETVHLGKGPVLDSQGKEIVERLLKDLKTNLPMAKPAYPQMEEIMMDIKTIEVQMLSPNPKTAIIREGFRSLHNSLKDLGPEDLTAKLNALVTS